MFINTMFKGILKPFPLLFFSLDFYVGSIVNLFIPFLGGGEIFEQCDNKVKLEIPVYKFSRFLFMWK